VQTVLHELEQAKGRLPSEAEVARALNLNVDEYQRLLEEIRPATFVCLDRTELEGDSSDADALCDPSQESPLETASRRELGGLIAQQLRQLPAMQRKVLSLYYHEGLRLREIAELFGVTQSRICQIHAQAVLAIKAFLSEAENGDRAGTAGLGVR
jgi:RNA polymerase sigma factor for flagellar operon FliA